MKRKGTNNSCVDSRICSVLSRMTVYSVASPAICKKCPLGAIKYFGAYVLAHLCVSKFYIERLAHPQSVGGDS